jgi:hypothetical protein
MASSYVVTLIALVFRALAAHCCSIAMEHYLEALLPDCPSALPLVASIVLSVSAVELLVELWLHWTRPIVARWRKRR